MGRGPVKPILMIRAVARSSMCALLMLSPFASFVPFVQSASVESCAMACCIGKNSTCSSGLHTKAIVLTEENLCGLNPVVIATPDTEAQRDSQPAIASISQQCPTDCIGALSVSIRRPQPRDPALPSRRLHQLMPLASSQEEPIVGPSIRQPSIRQQPPRGPPATRF
jgi:hypothetical protein